MEVCLEWFPLLKFQFSWLSAICIALNSLQTDGFFADSFLWVELPWKLLSSEAFNGFTTLNVTTHNRFSDNSSVFYWFYFSPFLRGFRFLQCFGIKCLTYRFADHMSASSFKVQSQYCYQFCTYTVFLLSTVLLCWRYYQKIKFVRLKTHLYN